MNKDLVIMKCRFTNTIRSSCVHYYETLGNRTSNRGNVAEAHRTNHLFRSINSMRTFIPP